MPYPSLVTRAIWHMHRTPWAGVVKGGFRLMRSASCRARRGHVRQLPDDAEVLALADRLNAEGYVRLDSVVDRAVLESLGAHGDDKLRRVAELAGRQATTHKSFWVRLSDEDAPGGQFDVTNPMVRFALQPRVLGVIARALGELPQLSDVLLSLSESTGEDLKYSQLWHRDYDDVRTIKLFAYLTDVGSQDDGPFTFIPGPASDRRRLTPRTHMRDAEVFRGIGPEDVVSILAPRLTTFAVETSRCLHMGSRMAPGHVRLLYTATFIKYPRVYSEPPQRFRLPQDLDPALRLVLTP